jgi:hypothetical protein
MDHGPGWIILEDGTRVERTLVSILPSRRTPADVAAYVEQLYVDRSYSISERLAYKKSRKSSPYPATIDPYSCIITCGGNPFLSAFPARVIELKGNALTFWYRLPEERKGIDTVFRKQCITIILEG